MTRKLATLAGVLFALFLAGCGNAPLGGYIPPRQPAAAMTCTLGATGFDVEVQFTNDATPCATQEQQLASYGLSWYSLGGLISAGEPGPADGETEGTACTLTENDATLTVMDAGGMYYGLQICSGDEQAGWVSTS